MKRRVLIISLRSNPAFIQHLIAYAKALRELGCQCALLVDPAYKRFPELTGDWPLMEAGAGLSNDTWNYAVFLNPSLDNRKVAETLKLQGARIIYVYHEPWQFSMEYLRSEGIGATVKAILAHRFTIPLLRLSDSIVLNSRFGLDRYRDSDVRFNPNCRHVPLLYDDEASGDLDGLIHQKRYFSYIGNPCRAHGFDQFTAVVRHALESSFDAPFLIASRQPLPKEFLGDRLLRQNSAKLVIRCGKPLTSAEINQYYAESVCVWNVYRRSTQSGVLPKAFMFGTPVLANRIGSFPEFVVDGVNGRFCAADDPGAILSLFEDFRSSIRHYAEHCRDSFLKTFYYRSQLSNLGELLELPANIAPLEEVTE